MRLICAKYVKNELNIWKYKNKKQELKTKVKELQSKRDEVLKIHREIKKLEENEEIKRYLNLLNLLKEKTTDKNSGIDKFTDKKIIDIVLGNVKITPNEEIYVYIGSYKINPEIDIIHGSIDYEVSRSNQDADYVLYKNIESKYNGTVQIPYKKAEDFELTHKVIFPKNG